MRAHSQLHPFNKNTVSKLEREQPISTTLCCPTSKFANNPVSSLMLTMSVHSWTLCTITVRPCGIHASRTVTPRIESQQTYRPHAAVYSSWILEFPVQKDISQRPVNTVKKQTNKTVRKQKLTTATLCLPVKRTVLFKWCVCVYEKYHISPGRVKHTKLATSRVMHMKAISSTIWGKRGHISV